MGVLLQYNGAMVKTAATWKRRIASIGRTLDCIIISRNRVILDSCLGQELGLFDYVLINALIRFPRRANSAEDNINS